MLFLDQRILGGPWGLPDPEIEQLNFTSYV